MFTVEVADPRLVSLIERIKRTAGAADLIMERLGWVDRVSRCSVPSDLNITVIDNQSVALQLGKCEALYSRASRHWRVSGNLTSRTAIEGRLGVLPGFLDGVEHVLACVNLDYVRRTVEWTRRRQNARAATEADDWAPVELLGSGVYRLLGEDGAVLYVGQSVHVAGRVGEHRRQGRIPFASADYINVHPDDLDSVEYDVIQRFMPPYNKQGTSA